MEDLFQKLKCNSAVILLLLTGAVFLFLKYLSPLLSPVIVAMLFVTIFGPLLQKLQKLHLHRQVGAALLLIAACMMIAGLGWLLFKWIWNGFPRLMEMAEDWKDALPRWADGWLDFGMAELKKGTMDLEKGLLGGAIKYTGKVAALGGYLVTFLIATILLAKDYDEMMNRLLEREDCHVLLSVVCSVIKYIATYMKAQGVIMSVIALLCALTLSLVGIPQGVLWGILAGLLDALPFIGTGVVLTPLGVTQILEGKIWVAVICAILYVSCIFIREILEPKLIGQKMGIRPIFVLLSLYAGIRLFGVSGIIKGPLGFIIIWETWNILRGREKNTMACRQDDKK